MSHARIRPKRARPESRKVHTVRAADGVVAKLPRVFDPTPPDPGGAQASLVANMLVTDDNMSNHSKIHDEYRQSVCHGLDTKIWKRLIHKTEMRILMAEHHTA